MILSVTKLSDYTDKCSFPKFKVKMSGAYRGFDGQYSEIPFFETTLKTQLCNIFQLDLS